MSQPGRMLRSRCGNKPTVNVRQMFWCRFAIGESHAHESLCCYSNGHGSTHQEQARQSVVGILGTLALPVEARPVDAWRFDVWLVDDVHDRKSTCCHAATCRSTAGTSPFPSGIIASIFGTERMAMGSLFDGTDDIAAIDGAFRRSGSHVVSGILAVSGAGRPEAS